MVSLGRGVDTPELERLARLLEKANPGVVSAPVWRLDAQPPCGDSADDD